MRHLLAKTMAVGVVMFLVPAKGPAQVPAGKTAAPQEEYVPEDHRSPLFLREDFSKERVKRPLTDAILTNPQLSIGLYGQGKNAIDMVHHASPKDDPTYLWLGDCTQTCAFTLRNKENYADLTGLAKIHWRTKQSGFHQLRLALKLSNGQWLLSDYFEGPSTDWRESEVSIEDIRWRALNIERILEGNWVDHPDLSRVDEIGWVDLAPGTAGPRPAMGSRVDWIEIYARAVKRSD